MKHKNNHATNETRTPGGNTLHEQPTKSLNEFPDWEVISSYSRAQALADGVLIDASKLAREAGFRYPVALTTAAWHDCVEVSSADHVHDETGRLWDVLNVLRFAIKSNSDRSDIRFCVDVTDEREQVKRIDLKCLCGPGDDAEPVLTIMLPEED